MEPHLFVALGATGDLMRRKLLPALHELSKEGQLGEGTVILGAARSGDVDDEAFRKLAREALRNAGVEDAERSDAWCDGCLHYESVGDGEVGDYARLKQRIEALEEEHDLPGNRVFYLALPPQAFAATIQGLGEAGLAGGKDDAWTRVVVEKPFGRDLASARELNALVHRWFDEEQVYRIDHYLGKETVQNLLVFRFANAIFEAVWNRQHVQRVEITVSEDMGVGSRAGYYDRSGALRDMVQNHLAQLLTLIAMGVPAAFDPDDIRTEKVKVLRSVRPPGPEDVVFGQYGAGKVGDEEVPGYLAEEDVAEASRTETFVAMRLWVENWRWQGVPFYLRTGKRMPRRLTQIALTFRKPPVSFFSHMGGHAPEPDQLRIRLHPDEGFDLMFEVKAPREGVAVETQRMRFRYGEAFGPLPEAYRTLLLDVMEGDQTLFVRADEVEASWRLFGPLMAAKEQGEAEVHAYEAGTWGPDAADDLLAREDGGWTGP